MRVLTTLTPRRCSLPLVVQHHHFTVLLSPKCHDKRYEVERRVTSENSVFEYVRKCLGEGESVVPRSVETRPFGKLRPSIAAKFEVDASRKPIFGRFECKSAMGVRDVGRLCPLEPRADSPSLPAQHAPRARA